MLLQWLAENAPKQRLPAQLKQRLEKMSQHEDEGCNGVQIVPSEPSPEPEASPKSAEVPQVGSLEPSPEPQSDTLAFSPEVAAPSIVRVTTKASSVAPEFCENSASLPGEPEQDTC